MLTSETPAVELAPYFYGGHWGQCLELLSHLCQYGDSILLVTGPAGIGKSALKIALTQNYADKFIFCEAEVSATSISQEIMEQIDSGFEHALLTDDKQPEYKRELVLLIDDAHKMSISVLTMLLQLKQTFKTPGSLHLVLFADHRLEQLVEKSPLKEKFSEQVHTIELEPLVLHEIEPFLIHYWQLSGNTDDLSIDKTTIKKIYSLSGGIPSKVQELAETIISGKDMKKLKEASGRLSPFTVGLTVSFGVLFCLVAFLWPAADQDIPSENSVTTELAVHNFEEPVLALNTTQAQISDLISEPAVEPAPKQEAAVVEAVVDDHAAQLARLENKLLAMQQQLEQEQEARRVAETKVQEVLQRPVSVVKKHVEKPKSKISYTAQEKRILDMPSKTFTLQILGASNEQKVKEFIQQNNLGANAKYFKSTYQGKPWFIVIYGHYTTRSSAVSAIDNLPEYLKKLQPWPRELAAIQRTIYKKR